MRNAKEQLQSRSTKVHDLSRHKTLVSVWNAIPAKLCQAKMQGIGAAVYQALHATCTHTFARTHKNTHTHTHSHIPKYTQTRHTFLNTRTRRAISISVSIWEFPKIWGTLLWGPYNELPYL